MDLVAALPERWRALALAVLSALVAAQMAASALVAVAPPAALSHPLLGPVLRGLHRFGHMRFQTEPGTLKLPFAPMLAPSADEASARRAYEAYGTSVGWRSVRGDPMPSWPALPLRIRDAWIAADLASRAPSTVPSSPPPLDPPTPPSSPGDRPTLAPGDSPLRAPTLRMDGGQDGRARVGALALVTAAALTLAGCATVAKASTGGGGISAVASGVIEDLRAVRALVCTPKLDPFLGDPRGDDLDAAAAGDASADDGARP